MHDRQTRLYIIAFLKNVSGQLDQITCLTQDMGALAAPVYQYIQLCMTFNVNLDGSIREGTQVGNV